jgi:GTPase SAR1 family protein
MTEETHCRGAHLTQKFLELDHPPSPLETQEDFFTKSQQNGLKRLERIFTRKKLFPEFAGFKLRANVLIVGQTGVGKTELVRRFASEQGLEVCSIPCNSWIPHGAGTTPHTVSRIGDFVLAKKGRALILFDEVDKILPRDGAYCNSWTLGIFGEILAVLDGDGRLETMGWEASHMDALKEAFIVGAGAFQHLATAAAERKPGIGFQSLEPEASPHYSETILTKGLPPEIASRFSSEFVILDTPTVEECAEGIARMREKIIGAAKLEPTVIAMLSRQAAGSGLGMRWFENYALKLVDEMFTQEPGDGPAEPLLQMTEPLRRLVAKKISNGSGSSVKKSQGPVMPQNWSRKVALGHDNVELRRLAYAASVALKRLHHRARLKSDDLQNGTNTLFAKSGAHAGLLTQVHALGWSCAAYFHAGCTKSDAFGHEANFEGSLNLAAELEKLVHDFGEELESACIWAMALDAATATTAFATEWSNTSKEEQGQPAW